MTEYKHTCHVCHAEWYDDIEVDECEGCGVFTFGEEEPFLYYHSCSNCYNQWINEIESEYCNECGELVTGKEEI